jgi:hypothetical protein
MLSDAGTIYLDEWDGVRWIEHGAVLPEAAIIAPWIHSPPLCALDEAGELMTVTQRDGVDVVYRWTGAEWEELFESPQQLHGLHALSGYIYGATVVQAGGGPTELDVVRWGGGELETIGDNLNIDPTEFVNYPRFTLDGSGRLVLTWVEHGTRDLFVKRFDGATWTQLGGDLASFWQSPPQVFNLPSGVHVLRSEDFSFYYTPTVLRWDEGTASWVTVGASPLNTQPVTGGYDKYNTWAFLEAGALRVVVREAVASQRTLNVYDWDGLSWNSRPIESPATVAVDNSCSLLSAHPHHWWIERDHLAGGWQAKRVTLPR